MIGLTGHVIDVCFCLAELFMCKVLSLFMANSAHVRGDGDDDLMSSFS